MQKLLPLFVVLVLFSSCNSYTSITIEDKSYKFIQPPGTLQVGENFYADETEITNFMYNEFQNWTLNVFGEKSRAYQNTKLNIYVWNSTTYDVKIGEKYFFYPGYLNYPVVGITYEQAQVYTAWRTERVAQAFLEKRKLIKSNYRYNKNNYFTIERYLTGDYDWIISKTDIVVPVYQLPSQSEWESIAGSNASYQDGVDISKHYNKSLKQKTGFLHNTKETGLILETTQNKTLKENCSYVICQIKSFSYNLNALYDTVGNVSEMVSTEGISKGGSWKTSLDEDVLSKVYYYNYPNAWTGFRNIAKQKLFEVNSMD